MNSILDIDLDYFNQLPEPVEKLERLLHWADRPVSIVVERHNHAFAEKGTLVPKQLDWVVLIL